MKKILIFLLIIIGVLCVSGAWAKTYTLKSDTMSLSVRVNGKNFVISSIKDLTTAQEFIEPSSKETNLWSVTVKHDGQFNELPGFTMYPTDAKRTIIKQTPNSIIMEFSDVRAEGMDEGFDIVCTVTMEGNNTYWDMTVSAGKSYGVWEVSYPYINNISTKNGDNFMIPGRGDVFVTEFDNPAGFPDPTKMAQDAYTKNYNYIYPKCMQYSSLTKGKSTLYMSTEDTHGTYKSMNWTTNAPNTMNVFTTYFPAYMGEAGHEYKQLNSYNISVITGDWFDAAKKYRQWGIDNNYAPFSKGKIADRTDLPQWWKDLSWCIRYDYTGQDYMKENFFKSMERIGIPALVHIYGWGAYDFDTHYPDWLPLREGTETFMNRLRRMGNFVMPYTNAHIVDMHHSATMQNLETSVLKKTWQGVPQKEDWAKDKGADNTQACTSSEYYNIYMQQLKDIFDRFPFDALYMDQVGASVSATCFDKTHNHPVGGGTFIHDDYNKMIKEIKDYVRETTEMEIPVTTEDGGDDFSFDGWLKCNEGGPKSINNPVRSVVYSGYVLNFGDDYFDEDYNNSWAVVNKLAAQITKGYVPGWGGFEFDRFHKDPYIMEFAEKAIKAREFAKDFFNLGEMVRPVTIESKIPKMNLTMGSHFGARTDDYDVIKTCSYNYNGKAMICFTNASNEPRKIVWSVKPQDLKLTKTKSFLVKKAYPNSFETHSYDNLVDMFEIGPLETVIYTIQ